MCNVSHSEILANAVVIVNPGARRRRLKHAGLEGRMLQGPSCSAPARPDRSWDAVAWYGDSCSIV